MSTSSERMECAVPVFEYLEERLLLDAAYIVAHPVNTTATEGWKAQFTADVAGTGPIDYQWQENTGGGWSDIIWAAGAIDQPQTVNYWTPIATMGDDGTQVRVAASNGEGGETSNSAELSVISAAAASETWTGINGDPWPAQWTIELDPGMVADPPTFDIQDNEGRITKTHSNPDGVVYAYINTTNAENVDQTVNFRISSNALGFGLVARRADSNPDTYYYAHVKSSNDYLSIYRLVDGIEMELETAHPLFISSNVDYKMRFFVNTEGSHTRLQAKVWEAAQAEPPWQGEITDDNANLQGVSGRFGLWYGTFMNRKCYVDNYSASIGMGAPNSLPAAHILADPEVAEQPIYVQFDGSGSTDADGYVTTYDWDFGDTNTDSGVNVRNQYASAGPYTVTLTVTDNDGATHVTTKDIIIYDTNSDELTIDNIDATLTGSWTSSYDTTGYYEQDYAHDQDADKGTKTARYVPNLDGLYDVYVQYTSAADRADNVPVAIVHAGGTDNLIVDQTSGGGIFNYLGTYTFASGTSHYVEISTTGTSGFVIADAVRFVPSSTTGPVTLASGGVAQVPIYIASNASTETQTAADKLEEILEDVTGGNFVQETYTSQTATGIYVGAVYELAPILPGVDETLASTNPEGVYVHSRDEGLVVAGHTTDPVMDAVYTFLKQDDVGVRYYAPWDNWWVVPSSPTLTVEMNLTTEPWAWNRSVGTGGHEYDNYRNSGDNLDWEWDAYTAQNRLIGYFSGNVHHNYNSVVPTSLFAEHPEYFSWREEYQEWRTSQINTRHPVVIEMAIDYVINYFDTNPGDYVCSLSPDDGSGFCECTEWACAEHPFSDNIMEFTDIVAAEVAARRPDLEGRMIGFYAYASIANPPTEPHDTQDNVLIVITTGFMSGERLYDQVDNWRPYAGLLGIRDYHGVLDWGGSYPDDNTGNIPYLEVALPYYETHDIVYYNSEGCKSLFPHIQQYWYTAEMFWSGHPDGDALLDQWYGNLFEDAAPYAREYWDRWNTMQAYNWRSVTLSYENMDEALAAESNPDVVSRIDDLRNYLHWLKLKLEYDDAVDAGLVDGALEPYAEAYARHWGRLSRNMGMISNRQLADLEADAISRITGLTPAEFLTWVGMDSVIITHAEIDTFWAADKLDLPANQADPAVVLWSQDFLPLATAAPDILPSSPAVTLLKGRELPIFFQGQAGENLDIGVQHSSGGNGTYSWTLWGKTGVVDYVSTVKMGRFGTIIGSGELESVGGSIEHILLTLPETGDYFLRISGSGGQVATSTHPLNVYASENINSNYTYWPSNNTLWTFVPPGTTEFVINLSATGGRTAAVVVTDVDGNVVFSDVTNEAQVFVPQGKDNQVWRINATCTGLHSAYLLGIPPYYAGDPGDLIVPVEALHPFVSNVEVNRGADQRSKIKTLSVQFSESVEVVKGDLTIGGVDLTNATFSYDSDTKIGSWDLTNVTLADDTYTATLSGAGITDAQSNPLDGDRNGYGGDNYGFQFFRLAGDANGDEVVNVGDLGILAANYGSSGNWWDLPADLNADGTVNVGDLGILAASYGNVLGGSGGGMLTAGGSGYTDPLEAPAGAPGGAGGSRTAIAPAPMVDVDILGGTVATVSSRTIKTTISDDSAPTNELVDLLDRLQSPLNV